MRIANAIMLDEPLDLSKGTDCGQPLTVRADELRFPVYAAEVTDGGDPVDLEGTSCTFEVLTDQGHAIVECETSGGIAVWQMPEMPPGKLVSAYLAVEGDGFRATTGNIPIRILKGAI